MSEEKYFRLGKNSEKKLVDEVCTPNQIKLYDRYNKFLSGQHQKLFYQKLGQYCEFYKSDVKNRIYTITKIYEIPHNGVFARIYNHSIYKYLVVLYLNEMLRLAKHDEGLVKKGLTLMLHLKILNPNYIKLHRAERSLCQMLDIQPKILRGFFNRTNAMLRYYVGEVIYRLCELDCIELFSTYITRVLKPVFFKAEGIDFVKYHINYIKYYRMATPEEILIYDAAMAIATQEAFDDEGIDQVFKRELAKYDIADIFPTYEARIKSTEQCMKVIRQFPNLKYDYMRKQIGIELKRIVDTNAEERASKYNLSAEYVESYKKLSSLTLLHDAPNFSFDNDLIYHSFDKEKYKSVTADRDKKGGLIKI